MRETEPAAIDAQRTDSVIYTGDAARRIGHPGVLAASGMIAGEGLAGVVIAFLVAGSGRFTGLRDALASVHFAARDFTYLEGVAAMVVGIGIVIAVCVLLYRAGRSAPEAGDVSDAPRTP